MSVHPGEIAAGPRAKKDGARPADKTARNTDRLVEQIALSQVLDELLIQWQREGQVGFVLPVAEWAGVLAVAAAAPHPQELIFPGLRESRIALFRGMPLSAVLRQYLGLDAPDADPERSQAGHALPGTLADAEHRVAAPSASPGSHLVHAVGAAMAARLLGLKEAVLAVAGVSALEGDDCHAALNFATVFRAPVVFLFRGEAGPKNGHAPQPAVQRASGYALPASFVSGDELPLVRAKLEELLATAREGGGPALLEVGAPDAKPKAVAPAALIAARALCEAALAEARTGRLPALSSLIHGVFAEPTAALEAQGRDLRGEPVVDPEEI